MPGSGILLIVCLHLLVDTAYAFHDLLRVVASVNNHSAHILLLTLSFAANHFLLFISQQTSHH